MKPILTFFGEHRYLSNFYHAEFVWDGIVWKHSEGAYQAAKSPNRTLRVAMSGIDPPVESKRLGKRVDLRPDWNKVRDGIMRDIVMAKFKQNPDLKAKLLATGDAHLEEGNTWGDRYWGVCPPGSKDGRNQLGKTLMQIRKELSMQEGK